MAVHPLRPATDRCLGVLLPLQLANQTRVHLIPDFSFSHKNMRPRALMRFYHQFPDAIPLYEAGCPRVTHPSATKILLFHLEKLPSNISVRLACVRHAASVHPEPGSNSLFKVSFCFLYYPSLLFTSTFLSPSSFFTFFVFSSQCLISIPNSTVL